MKLAEIRRFVMTLPEVAEAPHHHLTSFRVRGRIFATAPLDDTVLHIFVPEPVREQALVLYPGFLETLRWGGKTVGLRVRLAAADRGVTKDLLRQARLVKAGKARVARPAAE
jgi:hypothetical protein